MKGNKQQVNPELAASGIWTPTAKVLCFACHGNTFYRGFGKTIILSEAEMEKENTPVALREGNRVTTCDTCGRAIQLDDSTAAEHNLVIALREAGIDAEMHQTGGMNSACGINSVSGGYYLVTYNWDGDGMYVVGEYDSEGSWIDNPDYLVSDLPEAVVEHIKSLPTVKRIEREG